MTTSDNKRLLREYELYVRRKQEPSVKVHLNNNDVIDVDVTSLVDNFKVKAQLEAATTTGQSGILTKYSEEGSTDHDSEEYLKKLIIDSEQVLTEPPILIPDNIASGEDFLKWLKGEQ